MNAENKGMKVEEQRKRDNLYGERIMGSSTDSCRNESGEN